MNTDQLKTVYDMAAKSLKATPLLRLKVGINVQIKDIFTNIPEATREIFLSKTSEKVVTHEKLKSSSRQRAYQLEIQSSIHKLYQHTGTSLYR